MINIPYGSTVGEMEILHEGNIYDVEFPEFQKVTITNLYGVADNISYTKILDIKIGKSIEYYKEFYEFKLVNLGLSGSKDVNFVKVYLRLSKEQGEVQIAYKVEDCGTLNTLPNITLASKESDEGFHAMLFIRSENVNYRYGVSPTFVYPIECLNNIVKGGANYSEYQYKTIMSEYTKTEMVEVDPIFNNNVTVKEALTVNSSIHSKGHLNLYNNVSIRGDVSIGSAGMPLNTITAQNVLASKNFVLPVVETRPAKETLTVGQVIFHRPTYKVNIYDGTNWRDTMGNIV